MTHTETFRHIFSETEDLCLMTDACGHTQNTKVRAQKLYQQICDLAVSAFTEGIPESETQTVKRLAAEAIERAEELPDPLTAETRLKLLGGLATSDGRIYAKAVALASSMRSGKPLGFPNKDWVFNETPQMVWKPINALSDHEQYLQTAIAAVGNILLALMRGTKSELELEKLKGYLQRIEILPQLTAAHQTNKADDSKQALAYPNGIINGGIPGSHIFNNATINMGSGGVLGEDRSTGKQIAGGNVINASRRADPDGTINGDNAVKLPGMLGSAWSLLNASVKAVPVNRYAIGVVGLVAAVAICRALVKDWRFALFGVVILVALMVILMILGSVKEHVSKAARPIVVFFLWFVMVAFCATVAMLFTTFFFGWPTHATHIFG